MNEWIRQRISVLHERFSNASHWVRQRIPTLREWYYNAPRIHQRMVISAMLFTLSLPFYLFVSMPPMGVICTGIFLRLFTSHSHYAAIFRTDFSRERSGNSLTLCRYNGCSNIRA
jgi:hypothetical protein